MKQFLVNLNVNSKTEKGIQFSYAKSSLVNRLIEIETPVIDSEQSRARAYLEVSSNESRSMVIFAENKSDVKEKLKGIDIAPIGAQANTQIKLLGLLGQYGSVSELDKLTDDTATRITTMCESISNLNDADYDVAKAQNTKSVEIASIAEMNPSLGKSNVSFKVEQEGIVRERRRYALYYSQGYRDADGISLRNLSSTTNGSDNYLLVSADFTFDLPTGFVTNDLSDKDKVSAPTSFDIIRVATAKQDKIEPSILSEKTMDTVKELITNMATFDVVLTATDRKFAIAHVMGKQDKTNALER
ncbi:hypothetical protein LMH73_017875 [Vibrio splendidus]|nr:hypothetical protein [Vibrio splendidus]MCC4883310.1 hypothetical protein [Vibrio splendidus]